MNANKPTKGPTFYLSHQIVVICVTIFALLSYGNEEKLTVPGLGEISYDSSKMLNVYNGVAYGTTVNPGTLKQGTAVQDIAVKKVYYTTGEKKYLEKIQPHLKDNRFLLELHALVNIKSQWYLLLSERLEEDLHRYVMKNTMTATDRYKLAIKVLAQISHALNTIHNSDYVHLDVKPTNIYRQKNGDFVLGDFETIKKINPTKQFHGGTPTYYSDRSRHPFRDHYGLALTVLDILIPGTKQARRRVKRDYWNMALEGNMKSLARLYYSQVVMPLTKQAPELVQESRWLFNNLLKGMLQNDLEKQREFFRASVWGDTGTFNSKIDEFFRRSFYRRSYVNQKNKTCGALF